jgi:hypothetical protein
MPILRLTLLVSTVAALLGTFERVHAQEVSADRGANFQKWYSCSNLDVNGKPLPNPNVPFICSQVDAHRADCEMSMKSGNKVAMASHCFGWEPEHVRGGMPAATQEAIQVHGPRRVYSSGRPLLRREGKGSVPTTPRSRSTVPHVRIMVE